MFTTIKETLLDFNFHKSFDGQATCISHLKTVSLGIVKLGVGGGWGEWPNILPGLRGKE